MRLAVAKDEAFCFYYRENLELLQDLGAELVPFSPLRDRKLPEGVSGLLLGGGYPELHGEALEENQVLREEIRRGVGRGLPTVAECGGYLYLQTALEDQEGGLHSMAGVLRGHEFHYFDTEDPGEDFEGVKPVRGTHWRCIHSKGNLLCGFPHVYLHSNPACAAHFLEVCRRWGRGAVK